MKHGNVKSKDLKKKEIIDRILILKTLKEICKQYNYHIINQNMINILIC